MTKHTRWVYFIGEVNMMNIREMRTALGDTQSEFAVRYNIPFRTVQNWEAGVRTPPEYIVDLLKQRVGADLINRKTAVLPKYDPKKKNLPRRSDFVGAVSWLKAVRECVGENFVFALDEALMCQGSFLGRSDEYLVWGYGDDDGNVASGATLTVTGGAYGADSIIYYLFGNNKIVTDTVSVSANKDHLGDWV